MDPYYHGYDYGDFGSGFGGSDFMSVLFMILGLAVIFMLLSGAVSIVMYILRSIGLYKLSENRGMSGAALAWIPFVGSYRIGSIADDIAARNGGRSYYRYVLLAGGIVNLICGISGWFLTMLGRPLFSQFFRNPNSFSQYYNNDYFADHNGFFAFWGLNGLISLISIVLYVFTIIALNKIYQCYRPMSVTLWTILSVVFPFMQAIFPFILRNTAPADQWNAGGYYPMQNPMPNQNWQAPPPPQYQPYNQSPPVNGGYPPQNQNWQAPPSENTTYQTQADLYQPPVAPNPPEPWEIENTAPEAPPRAPWEQDNNGDN